MWQVGAGAAGTHCANRRPTAPPDHRRARSGRYGLVTVIAVPVESASGSWFDAAWYERVAWLTAVTVSVVESFLFVIVPVVIVQTPETFVTQVAPAA